MLAMRGYLPNVKYSDVALFVLGCSILGYFFHYKPHHLKNVQSMITFITGTKPMHEMSGDSRNNITEYEVHGNGTIDDTIRFEENGLCKHSCIRSTTFKFLRGLLLGFGMGYSTSLIE